jgi:putative redox protein
MTTVRHVARAFGSTASAAPAYRVDLHVGQHQLVADEPKAAGGGDLGPSPFGLLLSALAACTATTLRMYAARKGWDLATIDVDVRYDTADDGRGAIERKIIVPADLPPDQRRRLADLAERTPVTLAVRVGTPITTTLEPLSDGSHPTAPGRPPGAGGAS